MRIIRKNIIYSLIVLSFTSCGRLSDAHTLDKMDKALQRYIRYQDQENGMKTKIEQIDGISFQEVKQADTAYIAQIYLASKSWYIGGNRVYNINDTIVVYYNKNIHVLKIEIPE